MFCLRLVQVMIEYLFTILDSWAKNDSRGGPCLTYDLGRGRHSSGDNFGVTGLEWVPGYYGGRGLGLLTGGSDGRICFCQIFCAWLL